MRISVWSSDVCSSDLALWKRSTGSIDVGSVASSRSEALYWVTILFSQTLGTALGDWTADSAGLGYAGGAMLFGSLLLLVALAYFRTSISRRSEEHTSELQSLMRNSSAAFCLQKK